MSGENKLREADVGRSDPPVGPQLVWAEPRNSRAQCYRRCSALPDTPISPGHVCCLVMSKVPQPPDQIPEFSLTTMSKFSLEDCDSWTCISSVISESPVTMHVLVVENFEEVEFQVVIPIRNRRYKVENVFVACWRKGGKQKGRVYQHRHFKC